MKNPVIVEITGFYWSRRQGSNLRPHGPKPRALPTEPHLDFKYQKNLFLILK